jgi:tetraacyldisaccharide 4'-kinase
MPFAGIWRAVTALRNRRWDRRGGVALEGVAIVSVGNLAVGGTGKTPFAAWVARALADGGAQPSLLLSGYGADEVLLHRSWNDRIAVLADPDRVSGARRAAREGATVVVVDDGFQHRRLARDLDVVLLAVEDHFPGRVLPCGPYREPAASLSRADVVVLTRRSASEDEARALEQRVSGVPSVGNDRVLACVHLLADRLERLVDPNVPLSEPLEQPLALTAIARPEAFRHDVARLASGNVDLLAFADHHPFTEDDAHTARKRAEGRPIVVTEKDAVKLRVFADVLGETWVLRQQLVWDWGEEAVRARIAGVDAAARARAL